MRIQNNHEPTCPIPTIHRCAIPQTAGNAKGNLTVNASGMSIYCGYEYNCQYASASADHGGLAAINIADAATLLTRTARNI